MLMSLRDEQYGLCLFVPGAARLRSERFFARLLSGFYLRHFVSPSRVAGEMSKPLEPRW
mgnify:FL=1|jgi:hypothetical protein